MEKLTDNTRNYYKEIKGDNINVKLAAAGVNFKIMMSIFKKIFLAFLFHIELAAGDPLARKSV
jgi:hypothetical protein